MYCELVIGQGYRALYDHILLSGSRRFVVTSADPFSEAEVRFAEVGVIFYLDDLQEVSEMTQDQIKYVCDHTVIGRVRIKRVLNPAKWFDRTTFLQAEAGPLQRCSKSGPVVFEGKPTT
ncbi:unnamed protein product [Effrenium voratum]|nr:unnamed protein product [Effrenium voratum]